jgi:hypothetical protein
MHQNHTNESLHIHDNTISRLYGNNIPEHLNASGKIRSPNYIVISSEEKIKASIPYPFCNINIGYKTKICLSQQIRKEKEIQQKVYVIPRL